MRSTNIISIIFIVLLVSCGGAEKTGNRADNTQSSSNSSNMRVKTPKQVLLPPEELITNKDRALAFLEAIESGNTTLIGKLAANTGFKGEHPYLEGDITNIKNFLKHDKTADFKVDIYRAAQQGNIVFTHSVYNNGSPMVGLDIFEFEKGQIVNFKGYQQKITGNAEALNAIAGSTEITDVNKTGLYLDIVKEFRDVTYDKKKFDNLDKYVNSNFIEHAAEDLNGIKGCQKYIMTKDNIDGFKTSELIGEGSLVLVISKGASGVKGVDKNVFDIYRLENNKISEHWKILG